MPDYPTGVMVALYPDPEQAQQLALDGGQSPERLHLTLAYLGDIDEIPALDKLPALVAQWAEAQDPISGKIGGVGLFNKREEDGTQAFYASFDSPDVQEFRADLVNYLQAFGYPVSNDHGFTPHITLTYLPPEADRPELSAESLELRFDEIELCTGAVRQTFPLAGHAQEVIRKEKGKWVLYSKDGSRKLGGPYDTKDEAEERERQVQFFKHKGEEEEPEPEEPKRVVDASDEASPEELEDAAHLAEILEEYTQAEQALLSRGLVKFPGPVGVTAQGRKNAKGLIEKGLAYLDDLDRLCLTVSGMRVARELRQARRGEEASMPKLFQQERIQEQFTSALFPIAEAAGGYTGKVWDVTLIGAKTPGEVIQRNGSEFVRSQNGRLYDCAALRDSAAMWNGVKVYDNHLTDQEFEARQGMRSVAKEWVGTIVSPKWDEGRRQLRGTLKVVDANLAEKLLEAHRAGVLSTIGLSIDTLPRMKGSMHEGQPISVISGFDKIYSVDLVAEPAAGGGFNRLLASVIQNGRDSEEQGGEELYEWITSHRGEVQATIKTLVREALGQALNQRRSATGQAQEGQDWFGQFVKPLSDAIDGAHTAAGLTHSKAGRTYALSVSLYRALGSQADEKTLQRVAQIQSAARSLQDKSLALLKLTSAIIDDVQRI